MNETETPSTGRTTTRTCLSLWRAIACMPCLKVTLPEYPGLFLKWYDRAISVMPSDCRITCIQKNAGYITASFANAQLAYWNRYDRPRKANPAGNPRRYPNPEKE